MLSYHFEEYTESQRKLLADVLNNAVEGQYAIPYTEDGYQDLMDISKKIVKYKNGDFVGHCNIITSVTALENTGVPNKQGQIRIVANLSDGLSVGAMIKLAEDYI